MERDRKIDEIMTRKVISMEIKQTLGEAEKLMNSAGIEKLVITKEKVPIGILEDWKIVPGHASDPIDTVKLSPLPVVDSGTDIGDIIEKLKETPAVVVIDRNNPRNILGIATAKDLLKLRIKF